MSDTESDPSGAGPETAAPAPGQGGAPEGGDNLFTAAAEQDEPLVVALDGFEGPLHMLLELALKQKVDLREVAILPLAEQYLEFIREARRLRLDLAADYLVMAAYIAFMKSRLLLPKIEQDDDQPTGAELRAYLAFQLERLHGMQKAAEELFARPQLARDFFGRGEPEHRRITTRVEWVATQHDLLMAYSRQSSKKSFQPLHLDRRAVVAIDEALVRLRRALGVQMEWEELYSYLAPEWREEDYARSAVASTFAATLELAKLGRIFLKQEEHFGPLMVMPRAEGDRERLLAAAKAERQMMEQSAAVEDESAPSKRAAKRGSAA